jgi:MOSC domain-containing protein YiiM
MWQGQVVSLHVAPEASAKMQTVAEVRAVPGHGLEGDRYFRGTGFYSRGARRGGREVTLIEIESVEALDREERDPAGERPGIKLGAEDTRRNIATSGVPLNHLVDREFWVGPVLMRGIRLCEPCKHLEELTRAGVMAGLVHRGGLRAQIVVGGVIRAGDVVRPATT